MRYEKEGEIEAPFNMAIATLMRLDAILKQMRNLDYLYPKESAEKQKSYIGLIKQFYLNAIPLLDETTIEGYKKEILELNLKKRGGVKSGSQTYNYIYDNQLNYRLNEIMIELQTKMKKYFMPPTKDPKKSVINF